MFDPIHPLRPPSPTPISKKRELVSVMAQSIPTARILSPPPWGGGHLSGICLSSKKKMLQKPHGGASTFIQIPHGGNSGGGQIPDPWDKIKILFNDLSKEYVYIEQRQHCNHK